MKKLIVLFVLVMSCGMFAQGKTKVAILDDELYQTFEKEALSFYSSENYIEYKKLTEEMAAKLNGNDAPADLEKFEQWIKENLEKTRFESVDNAVFVAKKRRELYIKNREKEDKIIKSGITLADKYGKDTFDNVFSKRVLSKVAHYSIGK